MLAIPGVVGYGEASASSFALCAPSLGPGLFVAKFSVEMSVEFCNERGASNWSICNQLNAMQPWPFAGTF